MNDSLFFSYARLQLFSLDQRFGRSSFNRWIKTAFVSNFFFFSTCRMHTRYSTHTLHQIIIDMSPYYSNAVLCYWHLIYSVNPKIERFSNPLYLCIGLVSCDNADSVSPVTPPYTRIRALKIFSSEWIANHHFWKFIFSIERTKPNKSFWRCSVVHDDESIAYTITHNDEEEKKLYWIPFDYLIFVVVL